MNFDQNENDQNGGDQKGVQERKEIMQEFLTRLDQAGTDSRVTSDGQSLDIFANFLIKITLGIGTPVLSLTKPFE